ncbi:MAG TPA: hypothetical protein PLH01_06985, partial [Kiritimatiellia bacterium]|nr:hypothetical protein [Kiritimatiellia bacterium]HOR98757.1 hypothetical protein [Kiritimatiellia bacterium]HPK38009.1 hypothetical protein [Kiritimatiellia bacterium]
MDIHADSYRDGDNSNSGLRMKLSGTREVWVRLAGLAVVLGWGASLRAATQDGALRVEVNSGYNLIVASNAGSSSSYVPGAAYIGVTLHNDGTTDLTDIVVCAGNYNGGTGSTPGIYPSRTHD